MIEELRKKAEAAHVQYPQYKGHWDGWILVKVNKRVKTKLGVAFEKGELAIASPESRVIESGPYLGQVSRLVYSVKNSVDTSLRECHYQIV